jgi:nitronate monooxygenase
LYGAMIADVDYVVMGAGIPMKIPGILDNLSEGKDCQQQLDLVADHSTSASTAATETDAAVFHFSPKHFWETAGRPDLVSVVATKRPKFLPIVSSVVLAQSMLKRASGKGPTKGIDGFVVELNTAGGHNAPPRGFKYDAVTKTHASDLNERGEPVYGEKDDVDLVKFAKSIQGLPFWLAGSYADPQKLKDVVEIGGAGVQVGTAFALCKESGMASNTRHAICNELARKDLDVFTDPQASPTGFPFKVLELEGTLSDPDAYNHRPRVCNLGYLRDMYTKPDGSIGYRCSSEPVDDYVKKGGEMEATQGRKCLCNSLCANVGLSQIQSKHDYEEEMLITIGDDVNNCKRYLKQNKQGDWEYSAKDVVDWLLSEFNDDEDAAEKVGNQETTWMQTMGVQMH